MVVVGGGAGYYKYFVPRAPVHVVIIPRRDTLELCVVRYSIICCLTIVENSSVYNLGAFYYFKSISKYVSQTYE